MTLRLYARTDAPPFTPGVKGAWSDSSNIVYRSVAATKLGAHTTVADSETSSSKSWRMALLSLAVPITRPGTILDSDTLEFRYGRNTSVASAFANSAFFWISDGPTSTLKHTVFSGSGTTPFDFTAAWGSTSPSFGGGSWTVSTARDVAAGDYLIMELGARALTTTTASRTATMYYGGTVADSAGTPPTDTPSTPAMGWFDFTGSFEELLAPVLDTAWLPFTVPA